ncbi:MAG TPA: fibronectin/fibrinogen-binding protein, partial [Clostridia bacterium]|nr:fibronectin/fibrinogen-binding protein [Clostridia bacterium]
ELPYATLQEAALLAAYFSRARSSATVPVDYCERKYVKKPSGAKPGRVIYSNHKTIYITPDEAKVQKLLNA